MTTVYLSGPISGLPTWKVRDNFIRGRSVIWMHKKDWQVVSPLDIKPEDHDGPCPPGRAGMEGHNEACHLKADLKELLECDAIMLLEGWERSWGADLELSVARGAGLRILFEWQLAR